MNIHEHQAKGVLKRYGVSVPDGGARPRQDTRVMLRREVSFGPELGPEGPRVAQRPRQAGHDAGREAVGPGIYSREDRLQLCVPVRARRAVHVVNFTTRQKEVERVTPGGVQHVLRHGCHSRQRRGHAHDDCQNSQPRGIEKRNLSVCSHPP